MTIGRLNGSTGHAGRLLEQRPATTAGAPTSAASADPRAARSARSLWPRPRRLRRFRSSCTSADESAADLEKVLASVWVPLETAGIVLVVLVFVLLEHEAVRDRFIRIAGTRICARRRLRSMMPVKGYRDSSYRNLR